MSLPHILLGLLEKPASGYELKQRFAESLAHFWHVHLAQIYPTLHRMERQGWVQSRQMPSEKGPDKREYRRLQAGTEHWLQWLRAEPQVGRERFEYLAQLFQLDAVSRHDQQQFFSALIRQFQEKVAVLEAIEQQWQSEDADYPDGLTGADLLQQMTLEIGLARNRASLSWAKRCLERVSRPDPESNPAQALP